MQNEFRLGGFGGYRGLLIPEHGWGRHQCDEGKERRSKHFVKPPSFRATTKSPSPALSRHEFGHRLVLFAQARLDHVPDDQAGPCTICPVQERFLVENSRTPCATCGNTIDRSEKTRETKMISSQQLPRTEQSPKLYPQTDPIGCVKDCTNSSTDRIRQNVARPHFSSN